jgi:hypothetical protein
VDWRPARALVYSYQSSDGTVGHGADSMRLDATGKVAEWRCHYATP